MDDRSQPPLELSADAVTPDPEPQNDLLGSAHRVFVKDGRRCWLVPVIDIVVFAAEGNYTRVSFEEFRPLVARSLRYLENRLDPRVFFRASRKHIINLRRVTQIETRPDATLVAQMHDGSKIPLSRRRSRVFKMLMTI